MAVNYSTFLQNWNTPSMSTHFKTPLRDTSAARFVDRKERMVKLGISYSCLFLGSLSSSLLSKFYFVHGGSSRWVSTWVQTAGFPLLLLPICIPCLIGRRTRLPFSGFDRRKLMWSVVIGLMLGANNFLFSWGTSYLPLSTSSLLLSSQLAFTLLLSAVIVEQKISFTNLNCVVLLTLSSTLLALSSGHNRPEGLTTDKYFVGFFSTVGAGLLFALYLPLVEKLYREVPSYQTMVEMQLVIETAATVLATVGMMAGGGLSEMRREAVRGFDLGSDAYWSVVWATLVSWQLCFVGTAAMVYTTTAITSGICMTALLAMNVVGGVVVFHDTFGGVQAVATALCCWGFCSYVYGMSVGTKNAPSIFRPEVEMDDFVRPPAGRAVIAEL